MSNLMDNSNNVPTAKRTPSAWEVSPALQEAVDKYITDDQVRFRTAQHFGGFLVDHPQFSNMDEFKVDQRDISGEELLYQETCKMMRYHGVKPNELDLEEITRLRTKLGANWKDDLKRMFDFTDDDFKSQESSIPTQ